ncbi:MAG: hypothetical protein KC910_36100, partial [Candidatus Eremiobacteraeota bacterium]|nr:hypothetical protein [Candidatus Eremiobacteraeota bacterium]
MSMVCLGTANGVMVFRPDRSWDRWELVHHGLYGHSVSSLAEHEDGSLYAGLHLGMVHRTQDWEHWHPLYRGLDFPTVTALMLDPEHEGRIYAGTSPAALFVSHNGGHSWERVSEFHRVASAEGWTHPEPPHSPRVLRIFRLGRRALFAAIQQGGVLASEDDGKTWEDRSRGLAGLVTELRSAPMAPERLYATSTNGFHRSDDLGHSWKGLHRGLPNLNARCLTVGPEKLVLSVDRPE